MKGDIFTRLSRRTLNPESAIRPLIPSRFAYGPMPAFISPVNLADFDSEEKFSSSEKNRNVRHDGRHKTALLHHEDQNSTADPAQTVSNDFQNSINSIDSGTEKLTDIHVKNKKVSMSDEITDYETDKPSSKKKREVLKTASRNLRIKNVDEIQTGESESQLLVRLNKSSHPEAREQGSGINGVAPEIVGQNSPNGKKEIQVKLTRRTSRPNPNDQPYPFHYNSKELKEKDTFTTPTIRVTIGRIDVRAVTTPQLLRQPAPKQSAPSLTLDDYLKQRNEGRR